MRISDSMSSLTAAFHEWNHILVNPLFIRKGHTISWERYVRQRHPKIIRKMDVTELERTKQYSFQGIDGSIFQLFYDYQTDGMNLNRASLAYFNAGELENIFEESADESYIKNSSDDFNSDSIDEKIDEQQLESSIDEDSSVTKIIQLTDQMMREIVISVSDESPVPWLRMDYSPNDQNGPLHHSCHMHIGLFHQSRIPLSCVPTPRQFVEFIISLCYPDEYKEKRLNPAKNYEPYEIERLREFNTSCFPNTNGSVFDILPYMRIPSH